MNNVVRYPGSLSQSARAEIERRLKAWNADQSQPLVLEEGMELVEARPWWNDWALFVTGVLVFVAGTITGAIAF